MFYNKYKKGKKTIKKDSNKFVLFEKWKSICIFMLLFYFEFFCNCQHELFMKMWILTVLAKKEKEKRL